MTGMYRAATALLALGMLASPPVQAAEIDAATDLLLRCGAGYFLVAADPRLVSSEEEATTLRGMGEQLLTRADGTLAEMGLTLAEREEIGARYTTEVATAFANDTDAGFDPSDCAAQVVGAEDAEAAAAAKARTDEIHKLMTCGAGFMATARASEESGDLETAANLQTLGTTLVGRADDLMVEAGMGDAARQQLGQLYGEDVGTKINAGEDLAYDWDACAALAMEG